MSRLVVSAPAKLNLHLQVLGRRPDGFHELRTLLVSIDLADELSAEPAPAGELGLTVAPSAAAPGGDDNLVVRAARALWEAAGVRPGARLHLTKKVPAGGGLGGGSADAAAALVLLDQLWDLRLGRAELLHLAAGLGSDVPFFLVGGLALGVGRGDEVIRLPDLPQHGVVVAVPGVAVPTPEVYRRLEAPLTWRTPDGTLTAFAAGLAGPPSWAELYNDLEGVVVAGWPEVAAALEGLRRSGAAHVALTGSGAAVFAIFASRELAAEAAASLTGPWRLHVGVTLGRGEAGIRPRPES